MLGNAIVTEFLGIPEGQSGSRILIRRAAAMPGCWRACERPGAWSNGLRAPSPGRTPACAAAYRPRPRCLLGLALRSRPPDRCRGLAEEDRSQGVCPELSEGTRRPQAWSPCPLLRSFSVTGCWRAEDGPRRALWRLRVVPAACRVSWRRDVVRTGAGRTGLAAVAHAVASPGAGGGSGLPPRAGQ